MELSTRNENQTDQGLAEREHLMRIPKGCFASTPFDYPRDNTEWNVTLFGVLQRKAENREEWGKLVVKSTVVPQQSARLRDR